MAIRRLPLAVAAALLLTAPAARGQTAPAPSPAPTPAAPVAAPTPHPGSTQGEVTAPPPSSAAAPPATAPPAAGTCDPAKGDICVNAETQEQVSKDQWRFAGFVSVKMGGASIEADRLDFFQEPKPDGTTSRRIVAEGNVVFMSGEERLAGDKLEMDLDSSKGVFENAQGFVSPGVLVEAKHIERVDADTYKISGGSFTSCMQPNPRWRFTTSSATLDVDKRVRARNVFLKVKGVPVFYIPYLLYPIESDQRSSGFLFPHFGQSDVRGYNIGTGFFWAMSRSTDQTFYFDHYTKSGFGLGHELRYALAEPSRGTFTSYFFRRKSDPLLTGGTEAAGWEHRLNWSALQTLPGKWRASVGVQESSNLDFRQEFEESLDLVSQRTRFWNVNLQRSYGPTNVSVSADSNDTFFDASDTFVRRRRLPSLRVNQSPRKIGRTGIVFQYEARAERLSAGDQDLLTQYTRLDAFPRVSRPLSVSFLQVTPQLAVRQTRYGAQRQGEAVLDETALDRQYAEASVEMRGPTFSRIFENEGGVYSDRFKHVIGPEVTWTYRSKIEEFDEVPRFDEVDPIVGTNEVRYGLVQRFYAKRPGTGEKPETYEFLSWRIFQTYYVNILDGASEFDPNYSSAFYNESGEPSHYSPVQSRLQFRPTPRLGSNLDLEYDVNFRELRSLGISARANYDRASFDARLSKGRFRRADGTAVDRNTVRGSARVEVLPSRFTVQGSADYNILTRERVQSSLRARYDVQCCGFVGEVIETNFNQRSERQFRFAIELANIGSIGNFMGQEADDRNRSFMGGR
ncbi:MAG TPA: LPS assembly protein LptD [Vicinamibacteria bacterium]|nr:LPS assembly protein LptD [Vicinamibacteria bacterium]